MDLAINIPFVVVSILLTINIYLLKTISRRVDELKEYVKEEIRKLEHSQNVLWKEFRALSERVTRCESRE